MLNDNSPPRLKKKVVHSEFRGTPIISTNLTPKKKFNAQQMQDVLEKERSRSQLKNEILDKLKDEIDLISV